MTIRYRRGYAFTPAPGEMDLFVSYQSFFLEIIKIRYFCYISSTFTVVGTTLYQAHHQAS